MKKLYYAVYSIQNHTNFQLSLIELGIKSKEEAIKIINGYSGRGIIVEYYE